MIQARTFDENAAPTLDYRVTATVEPLSAGDVTSDDSPLRRPAGNPMPSEGSAAAGRGPLLPWGEEFTLSRVPSEKNYTTTLSDRRGEVASRRRSSDPRPAHRAHRVRGEHPGR